jgi:hypothetical protein
MIPKKKERWHPGAWWATLFQWVLSRWGRIFLIGGIVIQYIVLQNQYSYWTSSSISGFTRSSGQYDYLSSLSMSARNKTATMSPGDALKYKVTDGIMTYWQALIDTTSHLYWEEIASYATTVQVGQFCLPWSRGQKEADDWWTHHPDWEPFNESERGYCFRPAPNPTKREYLTQVYQHQFGKPQNCSNLFVTKMWSSGWSADITNLVHTLQYGMQYGQVMQVTSNPWHYAAPDQAKRSNKIPSTPACPFLSMYCYFLNLTSCAVQDPNAYSREYDYRTPPRMPPRARKWLPDYIVRPQTWLRYKVYQFVQEQHQSAIPPSAVPCTVMHVRRGDVLQHGSISRRYHAISEYLNMTPSANAASPSFKIHPNILLLTDDANAIGEAQQFSQYHWMFVQRPRFRADEGGWEHQLPSSDPIFEMTVLLGTFFLVQQCQSLVYSSSGFSTWLLQEMEKNTDDGMSVGRCNLDDAIKYELGVHNVASKSVSTVFAKHKNDIVVGK